MFSTLVNRLASGTPEVKKLIDEAAEFRTLMAEINKARCVIEFDAEGKITSVNENALKALGYSQNELLDQHHRALVGRAEATGAEYQAFWQNLSAGKAQAGNFKLQNKEGNAVWFQGYYAPIIGSNGALRKVTAFITDNTADKVNTLALQGEDQAVHQSFGVMECDMKGSILDCNALFLKPLGYDKSEVVGKSVTLFLEPNTSQSAEYKGMWEKLNLGQSESRQIKRIAKDGKEYWFYSTYVPMKDEQDKPYKVIVYSYCITAQKLQIAEMQGQLTAINKIQGVIEFDLKGTILAVNENSAKVTGYAENEIVGNHHSMFVDSAYKASNEYKAFWEKLGRGEADAGQYRRVGKGGKEVWLQASYNPIFDMNGNAFKVVKYATDITKNIEKERAEAAKATEALTIKSTLEAASVNMMMADNDGVIRYMNPSTEKLMQASAGNFRKVLPHFDPNKIIGQNFDIFHKNPSHQRNLLGALKETYTTTLGLGDAYFRLSASPLYNGDGSRLGSVLEWMDVTKERKVEDDISRIVEAASNGDLTHRLDTEGQSAATAKTLDSINGLLDKMTEVVVQVKEAGETINTAAGEIATGNNDLSSRTEQQASSLEETASSMEELASTVKQNAENAKQANQLAAAASGVALKGGEVVGQVVTTMDAINSSAKKIEDIISVIDGIAFQTNILALNAAVEAARAGEQGRGFAVVAGEVRNLAQRSASAAKEIKELITDSVSKTAEGTAQVENAGKTMQEIVSSVQRVTDIMGEISAASSEQSSGIDQVNTAITSMDEVTQQNAALVEQAAAAAESLVEQAATLMDSVNEFKLKGGASNERRATGSAMRSPSRPVAKSVPAKPVTAKVLAKTGTDDGDWEEF